MRNQHAMRAPIVLVPLFFALLFGVRTVRGQEVIPIISVTVNKSLVFRLAGKAQRVSVTQPDIADVVVVSPNQVLINGKSVGTTSLVIWEEAGTVTNFDLMVHADIDAMRRQFKALFPEESIEVSTSGPSIVLRGEVSNEVVYDKILEVAETYLPPKAKEEVAPAAPTQAVSVTASQPRLPQTGTAFAGGGQLAFTEERQLTDVDRWAAKRAIQGIIDLLVIRDVRQIQLNVIVAEVSLTKLREIGFDFLLSIEHGGKTTSLDSFAGSLGGFPSTLFGDIDQQGKLTFGRATSGILTQITNTYQLTTLYRLFQNRDVTQILSEPKLVIKNGRSGGFLAGGEFPVPITTTERIEIDFKPFGVRLDFLPTITWSNTIDLRVFPEVSEIDPSVTVQGIPGLRVRRSVSRVEMKEGESLILSGLLDRKTLRDLTKVPLLGDIPFLGTFFRTTRFRDQETELIFVITPQFVKPLKPGQKPVIPSMEKYDDPDMRQIPPLADPASESPSSRQTPEKKPESSSILPQQNKPASSIQEQNIPDSRQAPPTAEHPSSSTPEAPSAPPTPLSTLPLPAGEISNATSSVQPEFGEKRTVSRGAATLLLSKIEGPSITRVQKSKAGLKTTAKRRRLPSRPKPAEQRSIVYENSHSPSPRQPEASSQPVTQTAAPSASSTARKFLTDIFGRLLPLNPQLQLGNQADDQL